MLTGFSETLVRKYQTTRRHIPEASNFQCHHRDNFGYQVFQCLTYMLCRDIAEMKAIRFIEQATNYSGDVRKSIQGC
jgi:hypothetical protein